MTIPRPRLVNAYVCLVTAAGLSVISYSLVQTARVPSRGWLVLAALTGLASLFPVYLPRPKGKDRGVLLTVSSLFTFTAILLYGPAVATVIAAVDSTIGTLRARRSMKTLDKILFNISVMPPVAFVTGHVFYLAYREEIPLNPSGDHSTLAVFALMTGCAFVFFLMTTTMVGIVISLATGSAFRKMWRQSFVSAALTNFAEASAAVVVFLNFPQRSILAIGIALPTAVVIYYAYKINLTRIAEAQKHVEKINELYHSTIEALAMAVDAKDQVTHGHIHRVQALALGLATQCGLREEEDLEALRAASLLHDIGKLATPDYILNKPSALTDSEMETMKSHAAVGAEILSSVPFPYPVIPLVRHHHEKWDGTGYPDGLAGEAIPLGARILAIVDCYDALRSDRPYRPALSRSAALDYISSESGKAYDPRIVRRLVESIDALEAEIARTEPESPSNGARRAASKHENWLDRGIGNTVFHDIASAHREVQALHEISQAVGRLLNVSETLTLLGDRVGKLVPSDGCAIFLINSDNQTLSAYHADGKHSDRINSLQLHLGEGVSGWVAANHRPLVNVSPAPDLRGLPDFENSFKSCIASPLMLDQNLVGVITLFSENASAFRPDHLRILESISHYAATAISNAIIYEETKEDAYTDVLTGMPNLRYFRMFAEQELRRAERSNYPVTLVMMDLDFFKKVNDELGHKTGDRVLIEVSHVLRNQMRKSDTCIRYGGDEFVGIFPGLDHEDVHVLIEKLQSAVDDHVIRLPAGQSIQIGVSVGAATLPIDGNRLDLLLAKADARMYENKTDRNQSRQQTGQLIPFSKRRLGKPVGAAENAEQVLSAN